MDVTFATEKFSGVVRKTVHVLSSDPERPSFPLQISAFVGAPPVTLGVEPPGGIDFDHFSAAERKEGRVVLTNYGPETIEISIIALPRDFLSARLSSRKIPPRKSIELDVETRGAPPIGQFSDAVTLRLDEAHDTRLSVPIKGIGISP